MMRDGVVSRAAGPASHRPEPPTRPAGYAIGIPTVRRHPPQPAGNV